MSTENVTKALQVNATTGNGVTTLVLPEPRLVTFKITGNGSPLTIRRGGFGYSGNSFYGGGSVGGPLINHRVQAAAIYVR
jgi:hypothetical protein